MKKKLQDTASIHTVGHTILILAIVVLLGTSMGCGFFNTVVDEVDVEGDTPDNGKDDVSVDDKEDAPGSIFTTGPGEGSIGDQIAANAELIAALDQDAVQLRVVDGRVVVESVHLGEAILSGIQDGKIVVVDATQVFDLQKLDEIYIAYRGADELRAASKELEALLLSGGVVYLIAQKA